MKGKNHITIKPGTSASSLLATVLLASALLTGCAREDSFDDDAKDGACHIELRSADMEQLTVTRTTPIDGYESLDTLYKKNNENFSISVMWFDPYHEAMSETEKQQDISGSHTTECNAPGTFTYNPSNAESERWQSSLYLVSGREYRLYAFSWPNSENPKMEIASNYKGATITVYNYPIIGKTDYMYSVGNSNANGSPVVERQNAKGNFLYKVLSQQDYGRNETFLLLNHLMSKISFEIKIDASYTELRKIKLKKVSIGPQEGSASWVNAKLAYLENSVDFTWTASNSTATLDTINIYNKDAGEELQTDSYLSLGGCYFAPVYNGDNLAASVSPELTFTFDVYDTQNTTTRQTVTVKNTSIASQLSKSAGGLASGKNYLMKIIVKPTYLYVLSDNDAIDLKVELE